MRTRNEIELDAVEQEMAKKAEEIQHIWGKCDEEERAASPEETAEVQRLHKHITQTLKNRQAELKDAVAVEQEVRRVSLEMGRKNREQEANGTGNGVEFSTDYNVTRGGAQLDRMIANGQEYVKSIGKQFVESKGYKDVQQRWENGRYQFNTGGLEVKAAGTLTEAAGYGAGLIPVPQVVPGVVQTLFQRRTVEDLLMPGQATTNSLRYIVEGTATNSAAGVAEAGAKPASNLGLSVTDEPIKKIATTLVVTDEINGLLAA